MTEHKCPYGGFMTGYHREIYKCGQDGWLCDRCKQKQAYANTRAIVMAILKTIPDISGSTVEILASQCLTPTYREIYEN